tara:strand:- start:54 stop:1391 length:1338 start_codon:yes stop_codon:yes gene_type:complete
MQAVHLDLSDFKRKRPSLLNLLNLIEDTAKEGISYDKRTKTLPYCTDIERNRGVIFPFVLLDTHQPEFKSMLEDIINYCEHYVEQYDPQVFGMILFNKYPMLMPKLQSALGQQTTEDCENFLTSRLMEIVHVAKSGPVIDYHPSLGKLLSLTQVEKSCNVPVTQFNLPYDYMYLDWRNMEDPVSDSLGNEYEGVYVQKSTMSYETMEKGGLFEEDPSLKIAREKGTIVAGHNVTIISTLMVMKIGESVDQVCTSIFTMAYSEKPGMTLDEAIRAHREHAIDEDLPEDALTYDVLKRPLALIISTLLYMTCEDAEREQIKSGTEAEVSVKRIKNKAKRRKALSRYKRESYDCVRIGKQYHIEGIDNFTVSGEAKEGGKSTHIRFGHFNTFYVGDRYVKENGKVLKDDDGNRVKIPLESRDTVTHWIKPVVVNEGKGEVKVSPRRLQ